MSDEDSRDSRDHNDINCKIKLNGDAHGAGCEVNGNGSSNCSSSSGSSNSICRDFLRNVCRRGKRCKYRHPEALEAEEMGRKMDYVFCHDYQNKECRRTSCKFIHCTREEEEYYRATGELPTNVGDTETIGRGVTNGGGVVYAQTQPPQTNLNAYSNNNSNQGSNGDIPVCKDYLKGECRRGVRCKFKHITNNNYATDGYAPEMETGLRNGRRRERTFDRTYDRYEDGTGNNDYYEPDLKRRHYDDLLGLLSSRPTSLPLTFGYHHLEEENVLLRRKIEELKKQVTDLTATNEFLLDQNAQLRLGKQATCTVSPVTQSQLMSNSISATQTPVPSAIAQISQSMAALSNAAAELTGAAQAATLAAAGNTGVPPPPPPPISVPVSIAPPQMTQGPGGQMNPDSMATVSLTQAIPVSSLSQNMIMTMSGPSTPLVSYPIMTQAMRPVLPQNTLAH